MAPNGIVRLDIKQIVICPNKSVKNGGFQTIAGIVANDDQRI